MIELFEKCPKCGGDGWYMVQLDDYASARQEQCEYCLAVGYIPHEAAKALDASETVDLDAQIQLLVKAKAWLETEPNAPKHFTKEGNEISRDTIRKLLDAEVGRLKGVGE